MTDDLLKEGNRNFSVAMIALESGDFAKSERLLRETVSMMGNTHPVSMLAMKTMSGIASEQGRYEDSLQVSLDLLDAQITTFGVNHAETSRTIRSILDMCKDLGKPQIADDIAILVQTASEMEKSQTTQSMKRLRVADIDEADGAEPNTLRYKIAKWIAARLGQGVKDWPLFEHSVTAMAILFLVVIGLLFAGLSYIKLSSPGTGVSAVRHDSLVYSTIDDRRQLNFQSPYDAIVQIDEKSLSAPFRVVGFDWHEIGILMTSSIFDKESWLVIRQEGLRDLKNNVYYKPDAPERNIVRQMKEVMNTCNLYFKEKNIYPTKMEQIGENSFQYHNPFSKEMSIPSIQTVRLVDKSPDVVADFLWMVRKGGTWPGELPLAPGVIHGCIVSYTDHNEIKQQFLMHCCDRYGAIISGSDSPALILQSVGGKDVEVKQSLLEPLRAPTLWLVKIPPEVLPSLIPWLSYRFAVVWGAIFFVFFLFYLIMPQNQARTGVAVLLVCAMIAMVASVVSVNM